MANRYGLSTRHGYKALYFNVKSKKLYVDAPGDNFTEVAALLGSNISAGLGIVITKTTGGGGQGQVVSLDPAVMNAVNALQTDLATLETMVLGHGADLTALQGSVTSVAGDVSSNHSKIQSNTAGIADNLALIKINQTGIAANSLAISKLRLDDLQDVTLKAGAPSDGQLLQFIGNKWTNTDLPRDLMHFKGLRDLTGAPPKDRATGDVYVHNGPVGTIDTRWAGLTGTIEPGEMVIYDAAAAQWEVIGITPTVKASTSQFGVVQLAAKTITANNKQLLEIVGDDLQAPLALDNTGNSVSLSFDTASGNGELEANLKIAQQKESSGEGTVNAKTLQILEYDAAGDEVKAVIPISDQSNSLQILSLNGLGTELQAMMPLANGNTKGIVSVGPPPPGHKQVLSVANGVLTADIPGALEFEGVLDVTMTDETDLSGPGGTRPANAASAVDKPVPPPSGILGQSVIVNGNPETFYNPGMVVVAEKSGLLGTEWGWKPPAGGGGGTTAGQASYLQVGDTIRTGDMLVYYEETPGVADGSATPATKQVGGWCLMGPAATSALLAIQTSTADVRSVGYTAPAAQTPPLDENQALYVDASRSDSPVVVAAQAQSDQIGVVKLVDSRTSDSNDNRAVTPAYLKAGLTAFETNVLSAKYAPLQSPVFKGTPTVPTPTQATSNLLIANTTYVNAQIAAIPNASDSVRGLVELATPQEAEDVVKGNALTPSTSGAPLVVTPSGLKAGVDSGIAAYDIPRSNNNNDHFYLRHYVRGGAPGSRTHTKDWVELTTNATANQVPNTDPAVANVSLSPGGQLSFTFDIPAGADGAAGAAGATGPAGPSKVSFDPASGELSVGTAVTTGNSASATLPWKGSAGGTISPSGSDADLTGINDLTVTNDGQFGGNINATGNVTGNNITASNDLNAKHIYLGLADNASNSDIGIIYKYGTPPTARNLQAMRVLDGAAHGVYEDKNNPNTSTGRTTNKVLNIAAGNEWSELRLGSFVKINGNKMTSVNEPNAGVNFAYMKFDPDPAKSLVNRSSPQTSVYSMVANDRIGCKQLDAWSDRRMKEAIAPIQSDDARRFVKTVDPVHFAWKDDIKVADNPDALPNTLGYIAQDVGKAGFAELVGAVNEDMSGAANATADDPDEIRYTVDYTKAVPLLHQALRDALERIEQLEQKLSAAGLN